MNKKRNTEATHSLMKAFQALLVMLVVVSMISCTEAIIENEPEAETETDAYVTRSGLSAFNGDERNFIADLLESNENSPGWPAYPRRTGSITESFKNETTISVGVKGSFFELISAEATGSLILGMGHTSNLLLVRTSQEGLGTLTKKVDGTIYLNYEEGIDYVGMCTYAVNLSVGERFVGKLTFAGNGISNQTDFSNVTEVYQSTNFFNIKEGDTINALLTKCERVFDRRVQHSVAQDLRNICSSYVQVNYNEVDELYASVDAALHGPEKKRLYVFGHHWNSKPVSWERRGDDQQTFRIWGQLSNNIHGLPDRQVYYEFEFVNGEMTYEQTNVNPEGDSWEVAAYKLIKLIADEAHLENRIGMENIEPGPALYAKLYEHGNYQGHEISLGVGHFNYTALNGMGWKNDTISSIRVPPGLRVTLYNDWDIFGEKWVINGEDVSYRKEWNDKVSSLTIEPDPDYVRTFAIFNEKSGKMLEVQQGSLDDGATVGQWHEHHNDNGAWEFINVGEGNYKFYNRQSKMILAIEEDGVGEKLIQTTDNDEEGSLWLLVDSDLNDHSYMIINKQSNLAATVKDLSIEDGALVVQDQPVGDDSQLWRFRWWQR